MPMQPSHCWNVPRLAQRGLDAAALGGLDAVLERHLPPLQPTCQRRTFAGEAAREANTYHTEDMPAASRQQHVLRDYVLHDYAYPHSRSYS